MGDKARFERHALNLGKLLGNLQALEMSARMAIAKLDRHAAEQVRTQLPRVKIGDTVELNALTNTDDLTRTLERFNKIAPRQWRIEVLPIVRLRDALAHGRVFGCGPIGHLRLLKFSKRPGADGAVRVDLAQDMTPEWFGQQIRLVTDAVGKVARALDYDEREFT